MVSGFLYTVCQIHVSVPISNSEQYSDFSWPMATPGTYPLLNLNNIGNTRKNDNGTL